MPKSSIGWGLRVVGGVQNWWKNRPTRIRQGLIKTAEDLIDYIHPAILKKKKAKGKKGLTHKEKNIDHFCRQFKANRKKLK